MYSNLQAIFSKNQDAELNSTALFLSLYLVLLAFFILLNSIAHPDGKKTEEAVSSVNIAFEANHDEQNFIIKKSEEVPIGDNIQLGGYFTTLGDVISKDLQLIAMDNSQGNVMQVTFPARAFFVPKKPYILPEKDIFMADIAKNIQENMTVEVVLNSKGYDDADLAVLRLVTFVDQLETQGVKPAVIRVGVVPGSKDQLQLRFTVKPDEGSESG